MNNLAAVGHHLGLGYILCCALPEPPPRFFFYAKWLCPCKDLSNPRGMAWRSQGVLSIYIWMMSAEIFRWYLTSRLPTLCFSEFHWVAEHSRWRESSPQYVLFRVSCNHYNKHTRQNTIASHQMTHFTSRMSLNRRTDILSLMQQHFSHDRTVNVSPQSALMQTWFQGHQPSKALLLPQQQLRITGHSMYIVGCHCRPNRLMNTVLEYYWSAKKD